MIILEPRNMHWICGAVDDEKDLCAHGNIQFEVNGKTLVEENDREFTVSGAAIFLLRTLEADYIKEEMEFNQIFPCCAHTMYVIEQSENVIIDGCSNGIDFNVLHRRGKIIIEFKRKKYRVSQKEWREAVLHFSDMVKAYYDACSPKVVEREEYEIAGYEAFLAEWDRRVKAARAMDQ